MSIQTPGVAVRIISAFGNPRSCSTANDMFQGIAGMWFRLLYATGVLVFAFLASFLLLIILGPFFDTGESFLEAGYYWMSAWPLLLLLAALSATVYPYYRATTSSVRAALVFVLNGIAVAAVGQTLAIFLISSVPGAERWLGPWS